MAISDSAKVDLLYKKLFGVAKTDLPGNKSPSNESIASPSLLRGDIVWQQTNNIPAVATTTPGIVQAYTGVNAIQCTPDTTTTPISSVYPTWKTNLIDWIPSEFGSTYFVQAWVDSPGVANPTLTGTQIFDAGSAGTGEWNFDYQSGVLTFIGGTIPASLTSSKVIYIVGYRYIGFKGVGNFPAGITIGNITINGNTITGNTGVSFGGNITAPYFSGNILGSTTITSNLTVIGSMSVGNVAGAFFNGNITGTVLTAYQPYITTLGTLTNLYVLGNSVFSANTFSDWFIGNIVTDVITSNTGSITLTTLGTGVVQINANTALKLPSGTTSERPPGEVGDIRLNTDTGTLEYYGGSSWIPLTYTVDNESFNGDGENNTYTLQQSTTEGAIIVSINGTMQQPTTAYTVVGDQITFSEIPLTTDSIDVRYIASAVTVDDNTRSVSSVNVIVGTADTIVDSFSITNHRSAKYLISSHNHYDDQFSEVIVLQGNNTVVINTIGNVRTGANALTFSANITGLNVNLLAQGTTDANNLRIQKTYFNL